MTLRLSSACSNQLSYRPDCPELRRFELLTLRLELLNQLAKLAYQPQTSYGPKKNQNFALK